MHREANSASAFIPIAFVYTSNNLFLPPGPVASRVWRLSWCDRAEATLQRGPPISTRRPLPQPPQLSLTKNASSHRYPFSKYRAHHLAEVREPISLVWHLAYRVPTEARFLPGGPRIPWSSLTRA